MVPRASSIAGICSFTPFSLMRPSAASTALVQRLPVSRLVPQSSQRISKIDVGLGGVEGGAFRRPCRERCTVGRGRLFQPGVAVFAFGERDERVAEVGVRGRPVIGRKVVDPLLPMPLDRPPRPDAEGQVPVSLSPRASSALPRLFWVIAQSSGACSRLTPSRAFR